MQSVDRIKLRMKFARIHRGRGVHDGDVGVYNRFVTSLACIGGQFYTAMRLSEQSDLRARRRPMWPRVWGPAGDIRLQTVENLATSSVFRQFITV